MGMYEDKIPSFKIILFCSGDAKTKLLKLFDFFLGNILSCIFHPTQNTKGKSVPGTIRRILIIRPGGIGDAVLLIPLIQELRRLFKAEIDILAEKRNREVFYVIKDLVDEVFAYDASGIISLFKKLRSKDYDVVLDTEQWHYLSAIFSYLIGKKTRVGFATNVRRNKFYTVLAPYSLREYEMNSFLNLLRIIAPEQKVNLLNHPFVNPSAELVAWAKDIMKMQDKTVALCLSGSVQQRVWSRENFRAIINYLIGKGYQIVLLGGKKELRLSHDVLTGLTNTTGILNFVHKINLPRLVAILSLCRFYIGVDSGILHIAYALHIPTISLFGPGIKEKWAPPGERNLVISKNLPCSPCTLFGYTPNCHRVRCMNSLNHEEVILAIKYLEKLIFTDKGVEDCLKS
jgi:ADP-heptose:LPS heptosyltransferase